MAVPHRRDPHLADDDRTDASGRQGDGPTVVAGRRILVVDNEPRFVAMLRGMLEIDGHHVVCAAEPEAAIALVGQARLDVAIVDLTMPAMSGWKLADALRTRQPDLGIILCTGWGHEITAAAVDRGEVDAVLAKPFRLRDLRQVLQTAHDATVRRQAATCRD
ncbi:MAG TPA: response regulator [Chloroflexota bacterium]|nr:response regulator [Chloroflexota bacterium]